MLEYLHYVPGRLRLSIRALRHRRRAAEAEAKVAEIPNVTTATANPLTGSLTINFDRQKLSIGDLWESLQTLGYVSQDFPTPHRHPLQIHRYSGRRSLGAGGEHRAGR